MGVPSFYRWLVGKYPKVVVKALEETGDQHIDTSLPNPNGMEFDNLYLDMNGIIHPCFHPDDSFSQPTNFKDVFNSICEYIDRLFGIVRPRKLLYMAIDGVAPRAKMNQQRSRRFRTAKDNEIAEEEEERLRRQFEMEGKQVLPKVESDVSDSNIITPGTEFMYELSIALQEYVSSRIENDAGWKDIKVILCDSNVPGEGEHKIMSFIRQQRNQDGYNPNTQHCLYGLDADLIMLALATHEVHFSILREDVLGQEQQQPIYEPAVLNSVCKEESKDLSLIKKPYQFLHVWILREYLELDLKISDPPKHIKGIDIERIIDDFVLMCFFVGNDFLPHMPTLEIHEGAIDLLMTVYKDSFKNLGGYLVDMERIEDKKAGFVKLQRVEKFILLVGTYEDKIFKKRLELREHRLKRLLCDYSKPQDEEAEEETSGNLELNKRNSNFALPNNKASSAIGSAIVSVEALRSSSGTENLNADNAEILKNTKELKEKLKNHIRSNSDLFRGGVCGIDKVRFGTAGSKERYYREKFSAESLQDIESTRKAIVHKYTEGLLWVLLYYFSGVPSWTWFYPYHYGPFTSDLRGMAQVKVKFQKGSPFKPFDQLMAVLPPRSAHALPKAYKELMANEQSPIIDFYPTDFEIDTDGKRFMWQGVSKLSFIDEARLIFETRKLEKELEEKEAVRNAENVDKFFVRSSNKLGSQVLSLYEKQVSGFQNETIKETIDSNLSGGLSGFLRLSHDRSSMINSTCLGKDHNNAQADNVLCVLFELPNGDWPNIPRPLYGTEPPFKTITEADIEETQLWHEYQGNKPISRLQLQETYIKAINRAKFTPTNSLPAVTLHKWAGSGLGAGRGSINSERHIEHCRTILPGDGVKAGLSASTITTHQKAVSSSWGARNEYRARPNMSSIENLNISESNRGFSSYGRAQSSATNRWRPSRNHSTNDTNYGWQNATPSDHGRGRGWHAQHNSRSSSANPNMQAPVPSTSSMQWKPRQNSTQNTVLERRSG